MAPIGRLGGFLRSDVPTEAHRSTAPTGDAARLEELHDQLQLNQLQLLQARQLARLGTWQWDIPAGSFFWSEEVFEICGLDPGAGAPDPEGYVQLVHEEDRRVVVDSMSACIADGSPFRAEYRVCQPDGEERRVHARGVVLRYDENGEPLHMVGTIQDIHDLRQAELERSDLRTQLAEARKLEAIGRLAGGIAHDFNNLLTVINGYVELAQQEGATADEIEDALEAISGAGQRAASITRQLLAFGRRQVMQPKVLSVAEVVSGMEDMLLRLLGEDMQLRVHCDSGSWPVLLDAAQLEQLLVNLAANSRDASPEGGEVTIEVANVGRSDEITAAQRETLRGDHVRLRVRDQGRGMDEETKEHLFEPFFTTKGRSGTGLGMATVYGVVKQSGGHIWVESAPGEGTLVEVFFPRTQTDGSLLGETEPSPGRVEAAHILVVEDDDSLRPLATRVLERAGYRTVAVATAEEAIKISETSAEPFDLLFTDMVLPGTGGHELARELVARRPELRVLFASGYSEEAIASRGVLLGGGGELIEKPYASQDLLDRVRRVLAAGEASNEGRERRVSVD